MLPGSETLQPHLENSIPYYTFHRLSEFLELEHLVLTRLGGVSSPPFASLNVSYDTGDEADISWFVVQLGDGSTPTTTTYQQGVDGYTGTLDNELFITNPNTSLGQATTVRVDFDTAKQGHDLGSRNRPVW